MSGSAQAGRPFDPHCVFLPSSCMGNINFSCVSLYVFDTDRIPRFAHRDAGGYNNYLPAECAYRKHSIDAFNDASTKGAQSGELQGGCVVLLF